MKRLVSVFLFACIFICTSVSAKQFNVLLFTKTDGWHHESIHDGVAAMRKLAQTHHFDIQWHEDAGRINDKNLEQFDVIVFLNTTGNVLNEKQQAAMTKFIQSGKGFVGIHSATDTEYKWPWFQKLVGRNFRIHPVIQTAKLDVIDKKFPGLTAAPDSFLWTDEWYEYGPEHIEGLNYLLTVDESTFDPVADWGRVAGKGMGKFHPIAWYHNYDGGRSFYTGLGHVPGTFKSQFFLDHLFGGIYWAATGKGL